MIYLPDTNVFSRYLRDRPEDARLCDRLEHDLSRCRLSVIVLHELEYGAAKRPEVPAFGDRVTRLKGIFPDILPFDPLAAKMAALVRVRLATLKPNAQSIGPYDALLAGHALAVGATLVTNNVREFERVSGLKVEDWS
ncbi:MAG: PIN domain-containing protein [Opitutaceae bacterium]|nr:PIN domain-containing protein [Opitutaceae bacterium]